MTIAHSRAAVAQSVERILGKDEVTGSNPVSSFFYAPRINPWGNVLSSYIKAYGFSVSSAAAVGSGIVSAGGLCGLFLPRF